MPTQTLPISKYLRKEFIARDVEDLVNPKLIWDPLFPHQAVDAPSIAYFQDEFSHMTDPLKRMPPTRTSISEFAQVSISPLERKTATLKAWGMELRFDEDIRKYQARIDDMARSRRRIAWWLAEFLNNWVISDITNGFDVTNTNDATIEAILSGSTDAGYNDATGIIVINMTAAWSTLALTDNTPIFDVTEFKEAVESQEPTVGQRYGYELTDLYLDSPEYYQLYRRLINIDRQWTVSPIDKEFRVPGMGDIVLHKIGGAMYTTGGAKQTDTAFLVDRNSLAATIYEAFDPAFGRSGPYNFHQYTDDRVHVIGNQWWTSRVTVVKEPKSFGAIYGL